MLPLWFAFDFWERHVRMFWKNVLPVSVQVEKLRCNSRRFTRIRFCLTYRLSESPCLWMTVRKTNGRKYSKLSPCHLQRKVRQKIDAFKQK